MSTVTHVKIEGTGDTAVIVAGAHALTITERGNILVGGVLIGPDDLRNVADSADFQLRAYVSKRMKQEAA